MVIKELKLDFNSQIEKERNLKKGSDFELYSDNSEEEGTDGFPGPLP